MDQRVPKEKGNKSKDQTKFSSQTLKVNSNLIGQQPLKSILRNPNLGHGRVSPEIEDNRQTNLKSPKVSTVESKVNEVLNVGTEDGSKQPHGLEDGSVSTVANSEVNMGEKGATDSSLGNSEVSLGTVSAEVAIVKDGNPVVVEQGTIKTVTFDVKETGAANSYANALKGGQQGSGTTKRANFRPLELDEVVEGADLVLPLSSVVEVNNRFANTLFGYFLGKRLAFPIVEHYVKNTWAKFGLQKVMLNSAGFFFFKFSTREGMVQVMESGPWLVRSNPIILDVWSPKSSLTKQDVSKIPVWVKFHNVPLAAFTEDGLSLIATKIGRPIMLDAYTSKMCLESWGRSDYARALIEIDAAHELRDDLVMAIPDLDGKIFTRESIDVDFEWEPPRCSSCLLFGHDDKTCPKLVKVDNVTPKDGEFVTVVRKGKEKKEQPKSKHIAGVRLNKSKPNYFYRPKPVYGTNGGASTSQNQVSRSDKNECNIPVSNPFSVLGDENPGPRDQEKSGDVNREANVENVFGVSEGYEAMCNANSVLQQVDGDGDNGLASKVDKGLADDGSESDTEEIYNETVSFLVSKTTTGASTPETTVHHV